MHPVRALVEKTKKKHELPLMDKGPRSILFSSLEERSVCEASLFYCVENIFFFVALLRVRKETLDVT